MVLKRTINLYHTMFSQIFVTLIVRNYKLTSQNAHSRRVPQIDRVGQFVLNHFEYELRNPSFRKSSHSSTFYRRHQQPICIYQFLIIYNIQEVVYIYLQFLFRYFARKKVSTQYDEPIIQLILFGKLDKLFELVQKYLVIKFYSIHHYYSQLLFIDLL